VLIIVSSWFCGKTICYVAAVWLLVYLEKSRTADAALQGK